jgi:hypothetical protein
MKNWKYKVFWGEGEISYSIHYNINICNTERKSVFHFYGNVLVARIRKST